ncbi:MAG TPA: sialate O-acetylesterase [Longimicrobiales bacterium]|nr:sialate O-acetylesterase [Longimicrobiales bacterium]
MNGERTWTALALAGALIFGAGPASRPLAGQAPAAPALRLSPLFTDGVVLQRDAALPVWGSATPGAAVTVTFRGTSRAVRADASGAWRALLPPQPAGGPYELTISAADSTVTLRDVLVGDVWVASGQSNMEFPLAQARNGREAAAAAHDSLLRQFFVPHAWSPAPKSELEGGPWRPADARHAGDFTAVGYFFARDLRRALGVPIGIIHTSWGGANVESWLGAAGQGLSRSAVDSIVAADRSYTARIRDTLRARLGALPTVDSGLVAGRAVWADPALDDASWATLPVPGSWETAGYPGMDGVAWYRATFELAPGEAGRPLRLVLGTIDDDDVTWVNGVEVGRTTGYDVPRGYAIPAAAVHAGRNVLAVRVVDGGGEGGIIGRRGPVYLDVGGERRALAGPWRFRVAVVETKPDGQRINKIPTYLYNAMLHPILGYPIKGVIWYQGESNANNDEQAAAYRRLMADLVTSWRKEWTGDGGRPFPFLWVQLPNYGPVDTVPPAHAGWATLRESQAAALALPNTGQAIAIDVGEAGNLHPTDKETVGRRLALVARKVAYGEDVEASGPTYRRFAVHDGRVTIEFDHAAGGLVSKAPDGKIGGFAVAGADRRWVRADARIDGDRVVVWSDRVPRPVAVRYAWSNSPAGLSLYNRADLPAAPFRTDDWP